MMGNVQAREHHSVWGSANMETISIIFTREILSKPIGHCMPLPRARMWRSRCCYRSSAYRQRTPSASIGNDNCPWLLCYSSSNATGVPPKTARLPCALCCPLEGPLPSPYNTRAQRSPSVKKVVHDKPNKGGKKRM